MGFKLTHGTKELYHKAKSQMSLFMTVRTDELMSEYDLTMIDAQDQAKNEMQDLAWAIFLEMED